MRWPVRPEGGERSGRANIFLTGPGLAWDCPLTLASWPGIQAVLAMWAAEEPEEDGWKQKQDSSSLGFTVLIVIWWAIKFIAKLPCWVFISCVNALTLIFMTWHRGCPSAPGPHSLLGLLSTPSLQIPLDSINFSYTYNFITGQLWRLSWLLEPEFSGTRLLWKAPKYPGLFPLPCLDLGLWHARVVGS